MGIWDFINSTTVTEAVKRNSPDPTAVKDACKASYDYCAAAVGKVDKALRVNGIQSLYGYMPEQETRSQISLVASKFAKNAAHHALRDGYKLVPGGKIVAEIISETMNDVKSENHSKQEMEAIKEAIGSEKISASRNFLNRVEMQSRGVERGYEKGHLVDSTSNQTPEDVLRIFMMNEFMGNRFADDLILPQIKHGYKSK